MQKLFLIFLTLILSDKLFAQKEVLYKPYSFPSFDSCKNRVKRFIQNETEFTFDKHPLEWAQGQLDTNLLKTDTLFDDRLKRKTVFYYNKDQSLFLVMTTST